MHNSRTCFYVIVLVLSVVSSSFAVGHDVIQERADSLSEKKMMVEGGGGGKFSSSYVRTQEMGINNIFLGWTEIPKRIVDVTKESNPLKGIIVGVFQGTFRALSRTASGISDMATFPIGRYDDAPRDPGENRFSGG